MKRERTMTAFYLETVLMVIIFVLVIAILSQVFGLAKAQSNEAQQLTNAVCLAQNAAEAAAASDSEKELLQLLDEDGNVQLQKLDGINVLTAYYDGDMHPVTEEAAAADASTFRLEATWEPQKGEKGDFVGSDIKVYSMTGDAPVYTLSTGVYVRGQEETQ